MGISLSMNSPPAHTPLLPSFVVYPSLLPWVFIHGSLSCLPVYYSRRLRGLRQNGYYIVYPFHPLNLPSSFSSSKACGSNSSLCFFSLLRGRWDCLFAALVESLLVRKLSFSPTPQNFAHASDALTKKKGFNHIYQLHHVFTLVKHSFELHFQRP